MKASIFLAILFLSFSLNGQKLTKTIFGTITDDSDVLVEAFVTNLNDGIINVTDSDGKYRIEAREGDTLQFSFLGMYPKEIKVEDITRVLNIKLKPKVTALEGVTVTNKLHPQERLEQEYDSNKGIIRTFNGYRDIGSTAGRIVDMENNYVSYVCLVELLRAKFPFLRTLGNCSSVDNVIFSGRVNSILNPRPMVFEVDGALIRQIPEISVFDIKRIAVLNDPASTQMYGIGGVIVINTYAYSPKPPTISEKLGLSNIFEERKNLTQVNMLDSEPSYLLILEKNESLEDAKSVYYELEKKYLGSPYFFLDAYEFFYDQGDVEFSDAVIGKGLMTLFDKNPIVLKALAYMYQEQGRFNMVNEALRQVFILRPNYAQSYFDLANSYRDISDYDFSAELYTRYDYLIKAGFFESDTISFNKLIKKEFTNLVALHKDELSFVKKTRLLDTNNSNEPTTRIVFEWNDSQAEFNLEFLQENNEYYVWNHNYDENPEDINREKKYGYNVAEYIIGNGDHYKPWQIGIEYLGNKSLTPTYLKITRYHNYGSKSQDKEVKVVKLTIKDIKQKLLSF